jgi:hypothetical protein
MNFIQLTSDRIQWQGSCEKDDESWDSIKRMEFLQNLVIFGLSQRTLLLVSSLSGRGTGSRKARSCFPGVTQSDCLRRMRSTPRSRVQISARRPGILTDVPSGFPQYLLGNFSIVPQSRPRSLHSTSFPIHYHWTQHNLNY